MINGKFVLDLGKLPKLKFAVQRRILKKAIRAGCKNVRQDVKGTAPKDTGALRQSIGTKVDSVKGETTTYGVVGPRSKFTKVKNGKLRRPSRYSHIVERRKPFLAPAWSMNKVRYSGVVEAVVAAEVLKEITP